jgi:parallel beta-helix repeat protein
VGTDGHGLKSVRATGASEVGIKITGDNNNVSFNSVSGSPLGVKIEGTGNDVRGGTVSENGTGVEFSATASNNRFRGAKVRNNSGPGIVVEGPGNTLDGNRVNGNTGDGIHVTATAAGTKLKSNQSGNPENGGAEYRLDVNAVNQGGNRADNIPIPKLSAPQKCAFFPAAGTCE